MSKSRIDQRVCIIKECFRKHAGRGLCNKHFLRLKKTGDLREPYRITLEHHGMSQTRFYRIFISVRGRCNPKSKKGHWRYGKRGIRVLWKTFDEFKNDMHASYLAHVETHGEANTTLERVDFDRHYCKDNCRWATWREQFDNTSLCKTFIFRGERLSISQWCRRFGFVYSTFASRIRRLGFERAMAACRADKISDPKPSVLK